MSKNHLLDQFNIKQKLVFDYENCRIRLGQNSMLLMHTESFANLHQELFNSMDKEKAQGVLLRMGFTSGQLDADMVVNLGTPLSSFDVFDLGPALHGLEGIVRANVINYDIDWEKGSFYGQVELSHSIEAEPYVSRNHLSDDPVCWCIVGYASGYTSRYFKRFIVYKEVECRGRGDDRCLLVGKPAEDWGDDSYINYFKADYGGHSAVENELTKLRGSTTSHHFEQGSLIGQSPAFLKAFNMLKQVSKTPINVLLYGETGVGKEVFAKWLHENSDRNESPFVAINCGAIPNDLIEAELFGVKRGAFTGASETRPGRFEQANGGTLFLDELGELSLSAQVKLLRVLQTGELQRLGDTETIKVDVRLVAATNLNLQAAIENGTFRSDLYFRVATYPIEIAPLRDRIDDIPTLANSFAAEYAPMYKKTIKGISPGAMQALKNYHWPGNIRELQNIMERAVLHAEDNSVIKDVSLNFQPKSTEQQNVPPPQADTASEKQFYQSLVESNLTLREHEQRLIQTALDKTGGNMTQAAKMLGITRRQVAYKMKTQE